MAKETLTCRRDGPNACPHGDKSSQINARAVSYATRHRSLGFVFALVLMAFATTCLLVASAATFSMLLWAGHSWREPGIPGIVFPVPLHSHNDYWREQPLHSALSQGCIGVEADVWAYDDELYLGHDAASLAPSYTFSNTYVHPLAAVLESNNALGGNDRAAKGVHRSAPNQTIVLLVDLKSDASTAWPVLLRKLSPLRECGWLSHVNSSGMFVRPVTVVVTGNAQLDLVLSATPARDVFFDAPLADLDGASYDAANSYYASASFHKSIGAIGPGGLDQSQLSKLREQIRKAGERSLKVRYWDTPTWPLLKRNQVWRLLLREGVAVLNVDHLSEARRECTSHHQGT